MAKETKKEVFDLDILTGIGHITLNNVTFDVEPVFLDEIAEFTSDGVPIPDVLNRDGTPKDDRELSLFLISVFATKDTDIRTETATKGLFGKSTTTENSTTENKFAKGYRKWIEKKIKVGGESVNLSDLDRKYHLKKSDIIRLVRYLYEFSGF